jgi:apolipoprotein N-acyltransferase
VMGELPNALPGAMRPPLLTANGVPVGALLCYDNAFPEIAAEQVAAGARCLCVLSNEAWYRGGGELQQLVAMAVLRALETATPVVRCTQDGLTAAIAADGRVVASLPIATAPQPAARILAVEIAPGPGRLPPMASLRAGAGPFAAAIGLLLLLHAALRRATLRSARTASRADGAGGGI